MFDTVADTINTMLGITILTIAGIAILCFFTKSAVMKKIIQCIGFSLWVSFWIGIIFYRDVLEFAFNIAVILFVVIAIISAFIWFIRNIINETPSISARPDPEFQCEHCALYEDCMRFSECFEPNCPNFEPYEDDFEIDDFL